MKKYLGPGMAIELLRPEYREQLRANSFGETTIEEALERGGYNPCACRVYRAYLRDFMRKRDLAEKSEAEQQRILAEQKAQEEQAYLRKLGSMGIPKKYQWANLFAIEDAPNRPKDSEWVAAFHEVANYIFAMEDRLREGRGLILYGSPGRWKSNIATAALITITGEGHSGYWISAGDLFGELRSAGSGGEPFLESRLRFCELLVIDNMGIAGPKDWVLNKVNSLLLSRYDEKRSTIITTNFLPKDLKEFYPANTIDKLCEVCQMIGFHGESLRLVA